MQTLGEDGWMGQLEDALGGDGKEVVETALALESVR